MFKEVIAELFNIGVIRFGEFILASGKRSPYYFDLRILPSYPEVYSKVINLWLEKLSSSNIVFDCIVGIASAGIAHAAILGYLMRKPIGYVRAEKKDHGTGKLVEGVIEGRVLVVDDVVTTGGTLARACNAIKEVGATVSAFTVILDREEGAEEVSKELGIAFVPLIKASYIFKTLKELGLISSEKYEEALKYLRGS